MSSWSNDIYYFIYGATLLLSVLGLWFTAIMPGSNRWIKRFFQVYFVLLMVCFVSGIAESILIYSDASYAAINFVLFLESLLPSLPLLMLTVYLLHCCGEDLRKSKLLFSVLSLWAVYLALLISALFAPVFSYITPDVQFVRGPWYSFLVLPMILIMLFNLAGTIRRRKQLSRKSFLSFLVAIVPITGSLIAQVFTDVFPLIDIAIVVSALSMYVLILSDQMEQDLRRQQELTRQQLEIANQRASIMVLQMRPHFLYNTLMSIYSLCNLDPQKARQVTADFTDYLRKNFKAVASADPIPFTSELEHTRAYLAVEQAQYEDSLFVSYDTPHTMFRVPPLTLQPIVENAVKHGRDPYAGAFHISVRTRKTDTGSEIVVEDDGRGFGSADDSEPHIALNNIRQRLEIMCGGSLTIEPRDGGGTVVTVTVPDSARNINAPLRNG